MVYISRPILPFSIIIGLLAPLLSEKKLRERYRKTATKRMTEKAYTNRQRDKQRQAKENRGRYTERQKERKQRETRTGEKQRHTKEQRDRNTGKHKKR